jgi:putative oxidoreductase
LLVLDALWITLTHRDHLSPSILLATIGAALALLGPGAWSFDAWLFGWKRIDTKR